ncbi:MAG: 7,8-didemethyl-8-hydroxy-5-deazariboflavin synthase subunit CofG [Promethearchaeota archaeon]|nr:MAG: 7,8-didemethyl-8-hydroxy-5-deazariboflavin synthase subunit CofG [Candidatus Lokiarchaeota archaeon]
MIKESEITSFTKLTLKQIRESVKSIKDQLPPDENKVITYSKNFTVSLSNYCVNQCGYCFYNFKVPKLNGENNVILISDKQITSLIQKALKSNCKEALIMSGERPGSFIEVQKELEKRDCLDFIEFVKGICTYLLDLKILPHTNLGFLTYDEMKSLKEYNASMGLMLESTCMKLFEKGGVHENSPGKLPKKRIEHIKNAGKLKIPFTTGLLIGIGESIEDIIEDLFLIKEINNEYGHIQEVIIQNFIKKEFIPYQPEKSISIKEMLRIVGFARIIFENEIVIQVPPNLITGFEREFIDMGVEDFGGISPFTIDYINPENKWPQINDLQKICKEQGYILKERFPIYAKFISKEGFCPENIKKVIYNINLDDKYSA